MKIFYLLFALVFLQSCAPAKPLDVTSGYALGEYKVVGLSISQHEEKNMMQSRLNPLEFAKVEPLLRSAIAEELAKIQAQGPNVNVYLKIVHIKLGRTIEPAIYSELSVKDAATNQPIFTKQGVGYAKTGGPASGGGLIGAIGAGIARGILDATEGDDYASQAIKLYAKNVVTTLYPPKSN